MKTSKIILRICLYYVLGYLLFNCLFVLTQFSILNMLGFNSGDIVELFINNVSINSIIYTAIYMTIVISNIIYNISVTNKLNIKLNKIREGSGINEK